MGNRYRVSSRWLVTLLGITLAAPVGAQEQPEAEDPLVQAVADSAPSTPPELVRAARTLAGLDRPEEARKYLKALLAAKLSDEDLAKLAERPGAEAFLELASRENLAPEAKQVAEAVISAAQRQRLRPERLAELVKKLQDPSLEVRLAALDGLREARGAAVGPLMGVLADPNRAAEHPNVHAALVQLGPDAVRPLVAMLRAPDAPLVLRAIRVLGEMDAQEAIVHLLALFASEASPTEVRVAARAAVTKLVGRTPTNDEAVRLLVQWAQRYYDRRQPLGEDTEDLVETWCWDAAAGKCVAKRMLSHDASLLLAAELARSAFAAAPEDARIRRLYLATMLEQAVYSNGLDKPLPSGEGTPVAEAAEFGPEVIEDLLSDAMATGHVAAATAAAGILGGMPEACDLLYKDSRPTPLVRAARHADRRLRMAAVEAIVSLGPVKPFAGSSYVAEALGFFASSSGTRRVLVAGPMTEASRRLSGALSELGYEVDTAPNGREVIRLLRASGDYELALVDAALDAPPVDVVLQRLRHDCCTGLLPVGVLAEHGLLERARHMVRHDPLAEALPRPHTAEAVQWQVRRLLELLGRERVLHPQRQQQASRAMQLLAELSAAGQELYDLHRVQDSVLAALSVAQVAPDAAAVLGNLGTPRSQRALVEAASRWTRPLEIRKAAVEAFGYSVEHYGILLSTEEITRQYERYNQSRTLDVPTQKILGLLLDNIEAPTQSPKPAEPEQEEPK